MKFHQIANLNTMPSKSLRRTSLIRFLVLVTLSLFSFFEFHCSDNKVAEEKKTIDSGTVSKENVIADVWTAPGSGLIQKEENSELILYGKSLLAHTSEYFGPKGSVAHSTNGMNCQNCHMYSGTKAFGNNYSAV